MLTSELVALFDPVEIWLFGSVARGDDGIDSDLDIMIVLDHYNTADAIDLKHRAIVSTKTQPRSTWRSQTQNGWRSGLASLAPSTNRRDTGYTCFRYSVEVVVMTRTSLLADAVRIEASADERASATLLVDAIGVATAQVFSLLLDDGTAVPLSPGLINLLRTSVGELAGGHAVTVLPSETELTPTETAELLGLSRPFVVRLLDGGEIPSHHLPNSRHRRIKLSDVLAFQAQRDRRRAGRQRLNDIVEAAGLPY